MATTTAVTNELELVTELLHLLSNPRRVYIIAAIHEDGPMNRSDLVGRVAAATHPGDNPSGQPRKRAGISIYQQHLPKLDRAGVLTWNRDTDEVAPGGGFDRAVRVLQAVLQAW